MNRRIVICQVCSQTGVILDSQRNGPAKFQFCKPWTFEAIALQCGDDRKIDMYSDRCLKFNAVLYWDKIFSIIMQVHCFFSSTLFLWPLQRQKLERNVRNTAHPTRSSVSLVSLGVPKHAKLSFFELFVLLVSWCYHSFQYFSSLCNKRLKFYGFYFVNISPIVYNAFYSFMLTTRMGLCYLKRDWICKNPIKLR